MIFKKHDFVLVRPLHPYAVCVFTYKLIVNGFFFIADNVKVSADGAVITISGAQPVNQGAYRCVASNLYGVTHSIASLIVRGTRM